MVVGLSGWGRDGGKCGGGQEGEEAAAGEAVLRICIPPLSTPPFSFTNPLAGGKQKKLTLIQTL